MVKEYWGSEMDNKIKLKNYTTSVPAERSISEIEKLLIMFGATHVMKEYLTDGTIRSISFKMEDKGYKLPANTPGVLRVMYPNRDEFTKNQEEQAERVTWRLIKDWLHAQLSIVISGQAQPDEVLLPYLWNGKLTMYEAYKSGQLSLEDKREEDARSN